MPEFNTERPRRMARGLGVTLAVLVAVGSLVLIAITQEPKKAVSSPMPAQAAIVPQIADAKSELEIHLRGKSFSMFKRPIVMYLGGIVKDIKVTEGQKVKAGDILAEYELDPQSLAHVYNVVKTANVDNAKKALADADIALEKLEKVALPIKQIALDKIKRELDNLKELRGKDLVQDSAVKNLESQLRVVEKEKSDLEKTLEQTRATRRVAKENYDFALGSYSNSIALLEWQLNRPFSPKDQEKDLKQAFLKSPIDGIVLRINPEFRPQAQLPNGFQAMVIAPMDPVLIRCKVHELDLVKLKTGDRATAIFDAITDKKFSCRIDRIPFTSRNPALEVPADYDIECLMEENPGNVIKDGMTCTVKVSIQD